MQPQDANAIMSFSDLVTASLTPVFLCWPLGWTQEHARQEILEKLNWDLAWLRQGRTWNVEASLPGLLKSGSWNNITLNFKRAF